MTELTEILSQRPRSILQPGPSGAPYCAARTRVIPLDFVVPAGETLHDALDREIKSRGLVGAYVRIKDAGMSALEYVMPALSPDDQHVAWYSDIIRPQMPGKIIHAGFNCGRFNAAPWYHCHGIWSDALMEKSMGHLLPELSRLSARAQVVGYGYLDARFERVPDPQTGFDLFKTARLTADETDDNAALLRLAPNIEIATALIDYCQNAGWKQVTVHGVGSLMGAQFSDGRVMNSFATEALITKGTVDLTGTTPLVNLDVALVGLDGRFMKGTLTPTGNPVMITFEVLLVRT